jgi:hypothetical protein
MEIFKTVEASEMDPMTNPNAVVSTCEALEQEIETLEALGSLSSTDALRFSYEISFNIENDDSQMYGY